MPGSGLRGLVAMEDIPAGESAIAVPAALCVQLGSAASQGAVRPHLRCALSQHTPRNPGTLMHPLFLPDKVQLSCEGISLCVQRAFLRSEALLLPSSITCLGWNAGCNALCIACRSGMLTTLWEVAPLQPAFSKRLDLKQPIASCSAKLHVRC